MARLHTVTQSDRGRNERIEEEVKEEGYNSTRRAVGGWQEAEKKGSKNTCAHRQVDVHVKTDKVKTEHLSTTAAQ